MGQNDRSQSIIDQLQDQSCSFCAKRQSEVFRLIAGHGGYICDGCVLICVEIITKALSEEVGKRTTDAIAQKEE